MGLLDLLKSKSILQGDIPYVYETPTGKSVVGITGDVRMVDENGNQVNAVPNDAIELISYNNVAAGSYWQALVIEGFRSGSFMLVASTGAGNSLEYSFFATNNPLADVITFDENDWVNITDDVLNIDNATSISYVENTAISVGKRMHFFDTRMIAEKYAIKVVVSITGVASNSLHCYAKVDKN